MAIPDFQSIMVPLLQLASDGKEHSITDATDALADQFALTREERKERLPSKLQSVFRNRVAWAKSYLKHAGLLRFPRRAHFEITDRGRMVLAQNPSRIDIPFLEQFPEFVEFRTRGKNSKDKPALAKPDRPTAENPEEALETAYQDLRETVESELLGLVRESTPAFFERLVVELLVQMGYGGSRQDAGEAIGRTGDEGIDGIIKEDKLGLDIIYIQAKKWQGTIGRPEIQKFAGALQGQRAKKGVFITTSTFTNEAREYAGRIESKIVLIDGAMLAQLMFDHEVGVSLSNTYVVKAVDSDYFSDE